MEFKEILRDGVDWVHLVQVTDKWRAVVKTTMDIRMSYNAGNILYSWKTVSFQIRLCFMELHRRI